MKLRLINIGRYKVNKEVKLKKPSWNAINKELKKHVLSKYPEIRDTDDPNTFDVLAGFRPIGQIWIENPNLLT